MEQLDVAEMIVVTYYAWGFAAGILSCTQVKFSIIIYIAIMITSTVLGFTPMIAKALNV